MPIHPSALVDPGAVIAAGATIGPGAIVERGVRIGEGTIVGPLAVLMAGSVLGSSCRVHAHAVVGDTPQDFGFDGAESRVEIGDRTTIREGVTIHRSSRSGQATVIGSDCYLMATSHVAHDCRLEDGVVLANAVLLAGHVSIGAGTFVGGGSGIHQFGRVGRLSMIGGNASLSRDVPPFTMAATGLPNTLAGLNTIGLRRAGVEPAERSQLKEGYRILFASGLPTAEALALVREKLDGPLVLELARFVEESRRGVCRMRSR